MAKKTAGSTKAKAAKVISRRRKARAKPVASRAPRGNPGSIATVLTHDILPAVGAWGATRVISRILFALVGKRWPKLAKHTYAAAGVGTFIGAWFLAHRWSKTAPFRNGILIGSGVAAGQGIAQTYFPAKYKWLIGDPKLSDLASAQQQAALPAAQSVAQQIEAPAGDEYDIYEQADAALDDAEDRAGARTVNPGKAKSTPVASAMRAAAATAGGGSGDLDQDLLDELADGEDVDDLYSGAFEN